MNATQAVCTPSRTLVDDVMFALHLSIFAVGLVALAGAVSGGGSGPAQPAAALPGPQQHEPAGTFTGDYVDGVPLHRLPAIAVTESRKAALARIENEDRQERATAAAGSGTRPPG